MDHRQRPSSLRSRPAPFETAHPMAALEPRNRKSRNTSEPFQNATQFLGDGYAINALHRSQGLCRHAPTLVDRIDASPVQSLDATEGTRRFTKADPSAGVSHGSSLDLMIRDGHRQGDIGSRERRPMGTAIDPAKRALFVPRDHATAASIGVIAPKTPSLAPWPGGRQTPCSTHSTLPAFGSCRFLPRFSGLSWPLSRARRRRRARPSAS